MDSWKEITGDQEILSLVQGCEIKFKSIPIQSNPPLPFSRSKEEEMLVDLEVQNLLAKGAIEICSQIQINSFPTFSPSRRRMGGEGQW